MTRAQLLTLFAPFGSGAPDNASSMAVFMYRQYPYLLVDVEFRTFRKSAAGTDPLDVITSISRPLTPPQFVPKIILLKDAPAGTDAARTLSDG